MTATTKRQLSTAALLTALSGCITTGYANELPMKPGMWETTTTITSSLMGEQSNTQRTCLSDSTFEPENMMGNLPTEQCNVDERITGNTMNVTMNCTIAGGGKLEGTATYTVNGDQARGTAELNMSQAGMQFDMKVESTAVRVGSC